jgi:probable O-glycosylation ligase (exosortase A-associated)
MKGLLFTYALTYGGAVASLVRPFYGLLVYVCFAIVKPEAMWYWSVPEGNYSRVVALALLIGWALNGFGTWQLGRAWGVTLALVAFWAWGALSATTAPESQRALDFVESMAKIVLPFLVGVTVIDTVGKLKALAWTIVLSQGYVALEMNVAYLGGFNRVYHLGFAGMDSNSVAIAMVTGAGLAFFLGLHAEAWWQKAAAFASVALMGHTVLIAFSRGGMIALIVTGLTAAVLIGVRSRHWAALTAAAAVGVMLAGPEVRDRFLTVFADARERDASAQSRLDLWGDCLDAMSKRPVLGLGPAHWPLVVAEYGWPSGKEAHSLWLQTGAEIGVPGLLLLLGFYLLTIARLWALARQKTPAAEAWLPGAAAMVVAGLIGFMTSAQFVSLVALELPYYVALVGAGVLTLQSRATASAGDSEFVAPGEEAASSPGGVPCVALYR